MNQRYTIHAQNRFIGIEACLVYSQVGDSVHVDSWHTSFKKDASQGYEVRLYEEYELIAKLHSKKAALAALQELCDRLNVSYENRFHLLKAVE